MRSAARRHHSSPGAAPLPREDAAHKASRPSGSSGRIDAAYGRLAAALDDDAVLGPGSDLSAYEDPYAFGSSEDFRCSGAVLPRSVEEVQAVLAIANQHGIPIWTVSTGRNLGYGGAAPRVSGAIVLDMQRMNRILEVDEEHAYALVEPGVRFVDLYEHLREHRLKLWMSAPSLGWGSVVGNALERGIGYTPYGDHAAQICGMEVVLANGDVVRTGMGALPGANTWQMYKGGYGPSLDGLFLQSNLGIVTKLGLWLMPQPDGMMSCTVRFQRESDLEAAVDVLASLRRREIIQSNAQLGNVLRDVAHRYPRSRWYDGPGAMPDEVLDEVRRDLGIGWWWILRFGLYGDKELLDARFRIVQREFSRIPGAEITGHEHLASGSDGLHAWEVEGPAGRLAGVPGFFSLNALKFRGDDCGHLDFSPIVASSGREAARVYNHVKARAREHGIDYLAGFTAGVRHLNHVFTILYEKHDAEQTSSAAALLDALIREMGRQGIGGYRAHLAFMELIGDQFSFNEHALRRLNETLKDALDPNGILSPGKQGIWPAASRKQRAGTR
ncbi:FAD-binding oxidoreductase [Sorangium sp. So ce124]|uniref:FAD-binding oxidoreductase n=1 Tax=Sorangium sp. So ce124 TaxID=3133280 RepID=UPI003F636708